MIPTIAVGVGGIATMTATMIKLPDGTEQDASEVICEGCDKPVSDHSCGSTFTVTSGAAAGSSFRTSGRRKDPSAGPLCPHCNGRLHTNMPAYLQNLECAARQYGVDTKLMTDPFGRVPLATLADIKDVLAWSETLATPITYGKMEAPTGGAGTYSSLRPKADPKPASDRPKKRKAADKGERIEDLAASVEADEPDVDDGDDLGGGAAVAAVDPAPKKSKKSRKHRVTKLGSDGSVESVDLEQVVAQVSDEIDGDGLIEAPVESPVVDEAAERERKRAERRAILAGSR